jgi:hypothetical protein
LWPRSEVATGDEPTLGMRIPTAGITAGHEISVELRLLLPNQLALDTADGTLRATGVFENVPQKRGDRWACVVVAEGARAGLAVHLRVHMDGFIRDVVPSQTFARRQQPLSE